MDFPAELKYTPDHEWVRLQQDNIAYVGITDFAQSELGDIVFVEVNTLGKTVEAHEVFGTIEAVKTTSDLFMPVTGKVLEFNPALDGAPDLVNAEPYANGWIIKIEVANLTDLDALMDAQAYQKHTAA